MNYPPLAPKSVNASALDRDNGQAGILFPTSRGWTFGNLTLTADRAFVARGVPSRDMQIIAVQFVVQTLANNDDAVEIAILDASYNKLVTTGSTTGKLNSTGNKRIALPSSQLLRAGTVYYVALAAQVQGTAAVLSGANYNQGGAQFIFGTTAGTQDGTFQNSARPIPSPIVAAGSISVTCAVALMEA